MAKRKYKKEKGGNGKRGHEKTWHTDLHPDTKKAALAVFAFVAAAVLSLSFVGKGGAVGNTIFQVLDYLLGRGYFFAPLSLILIGFSLLFAGGTKVLIPTLLGGVVFFFSSLTGLSLIFGEKTGGTVGGFAATSLIKLFDFWAGLIIVAGFFLISFLLMLNLPFWKKNEEDDEEDEDENKTKTMLEEVGALLKSTAEKVKESAPAMPALPSQQTTVSASSTEKEEASIAIRKVARKFDYKKPPLDLLQGDRGTPSSGDIRANANIIKRTLENFGIEVEMGEVSIGPTVTQYTLKPAEGVKLAKITTLGNDLSLALAAHPIRIEAPIPGKSLVGIEVPNKSISLVGLRSLLEQKIYQETTNPLMFAVGRDVSGSPVFADLAKMPHLLISGATGSGKSVSVHSIITSLLYRNPPEMLRFIIVDPKRVELSIYNDIPHLLTPVITDPKKTIQALRWAAKEMDRRYELLSRYHTRDIESFNSQMVKSADHDILPYLVIMIDELADLMSTFPREVESSIVRLAQMARAVGIHLIVATQRPQVEVVTGLIKANITSRIAFQVASQIDSRTVLDMSGAEKLLGNGDMLFLAGDTSKPRRIQGAFLSESEVKKVVGFLREESEAPEYDEAIFEGKAEENDGLGGDFSDGGDPLYEDARGLVLEAGKASASYLQRRLRVGYARAARLLDLMESNGVIGPADGAKPREVLIKTANLPSDSDADEGIL